jgi:DNA-binding transcriptional MerR regulator
VSYRIKTVETMTGISRNTITAWERRYSLLKPDKDKSGYRAYTDAHISKLKRVKALLEEGYQIGEVVSMLEAQQERLSATATPAGGTPSAGARHIGALLRERLLAFDRAGADELNSRLLEVSFQRRIGEVYMPLLRSVGEGWATGEVSIAQEHFASAFVREQLVAMLKSLDQGPRNGPLVVCAGFPGELHELGLLAISVQLALRGNRVMYLGADLPLDELVQVVNDNPADMVCQSVTLPRDPEEVWAHACTLREKIDPRTLVVLGGRGVQPIADRSTSGIFLCPTFEDLLAQWDEIRRRRLRLLGS